MKPNQKMVASDGRQIAVFPSQVLRITQNPHGSTSHNLVKSADNAVGDASKDKLYAPCDVICVKKGNSGIVFYQSVNPVHTPSGISHLTMVLIHDNNAAQFQIGKTYRQGEHIYTEGTAGNVSGKHVHYEVALSHEMFQEKRPDDHWEVQNSRYLDEVFFIDHTEIVRENATGGYQFNWKTWDGEVGPDPKPDKTESNILTLMLSKALPDFM